MLLTQNCFSKRTGSSGFSAEYPTQLPIVWKGLPMNIIINHSSMIPIYEQITAQIKASVMDGILKADDACLQYVLCPRNSKSAR